MPNKAVSKKQFRLFKGISEGTIPAQGKLTKAVASEMLDGQSSAGLPEQARQTTRRVRQRVGRFRVG